MKRIGLLCGILAMLWTITAPAMAMFRTEVNAQCDLPEIRVTVPSTASIFINPYEMSVEIDGGASTDQIISTPAAIKNESPVPLSVNVTITGYLKENCIMRLASESVKDSDTTSKCAFIYFEIVASDSTAGDWAETYDPEKHLLVRTGSRTMRNIVTLDAVDGDNPYGAFRLTGDCVAYPRTEWTEEDGLDAKIAFTFVPQERPAS